MKRKQPDSGATPKSATPKKLRIITQPQDQSFPDKDSSLAAVSRTPKSDQRRTATLAKSKKTQRLTSGSPDEEDDQGSPTPRANGRLLLATPTKSRKNGGELNGANSTVRKADRSAKRTSARALLEQEEEDDWEGGNALAQEILAGEEDDIVSGGEESEGFQQLLNGPEADEAFPQAETPSKRGRGRPKGSKNKRSPTPEGDLAPEERYFFQNRSGPPQVSSNTLASLKLLTHDEYFEQMRKYQDHHDPEKAYLMRLHARSFPQWRFELSEGFSLCLYGWGSKRHLVNKFAEWLYPKCTPPPKIIVVNGYTPKLQIRSVLRTIVGAIMEDQAPSRIAGQPMEIADMILSQLSSHPPPSPIILMINSLDAASLRRSDKQSLFARLAAHPSINLVATADSPSFSLLWSTALLNQFQFVFHDCTTFSPYEAELNVVDDVHELLGRKGRRIGGKEGVGFVLKSLPENARNLYRILLTEILSCLADGEPPLAAISRSDDDDDVVVPHDSGDEEDDSAVPARPHRSSRKRQPVEGAAAEGEVGAIEYRLLYQKAVEEFICSSEMNFRTLLKEFHDHQMIVSRRDAEGTEVLGVPLGREEMEGVLEDLLLAGAAG